MQPVAAPFTLPDRYRLQGPVASGGMAGVWAAHDTMLGRDVAVKVLAEHLNADASARERFQREARAAAGLSSHPNVVTIFDVGEHGGRSFIVMELRRGGTLADVLARGRPPADRAIDWLHDAAEALDAAHDQGIVHRDIKPANLLLDERGRVAVADFGIARVAEDPSLTQTGTVLGTASYISPEQAMGRHATPASDRYSLAVVAFELLTGRKPFDGEHHAAQARAHVETPPPAASARAPGLPPGIDAVLCRGMAKEPADRWPSAVEFVEALDHALREPTEPTLVAPAHAPPRRRDRSLLLIAAALGLVAAGAIVLALAGGAGEEPQPAQRAETPTAEEPTPEPTATAEATAAPEGDDAATLNAQGFELFQAGRHAEAVPLFRQAVDACGASTALDPCGYATFNLGASLNRSGRPEEAIPVLQRRLERWDDQEATVRAELADALAKIEGGPPGPGNGKAKGRGKDDD